MRYSIREYRPNELYCFQWIDFIIDQINQNQGDKRIDDKESGRLFTELVDNNEKILDDKINDKTIKDIIGFIVNLDWNKKFVKILRALCICNKKSVLKNQIALTNHILMQTDILPHFLFKIEIEDEEIFVDNPKLEVRHVRLNRFKDSRSAYDSSSIAELTQVPCTSTSWRSSISWPICATKATATPWRSSPSTTTSRR